LANVFSAILVQLPGAVLCSIPLTLKHFKRFKSVLFKRALFLTFRRAAAAAPYKSYILSYCIALYWLWRRCL